MLDRSTVRNIAHCVLPAEEIRQHLAALKFSMINEQILADFVQAVEDTANANDLEKLSILKDVFDCAGTGGSGQVHHNISTMSAFVLAAGGVRVAKFGNRGSNAATGSFDFLESAGIPVTVEPERTVELIESTNLGFLFAPQYFPALAKLRDVRKSIGHGTVFNILGPLLNPARPTFRVLGTFDLHLQNVLGQYLANASRTTAAFIVRSESGLDELDPYDTNYISKVNGSNISKATIAPFSSNRHERKSECTAKDNLDAFTQLLGDADSDSSLKDFLGLNSGAGFVVTGKAATIEDGFKMAQELLVSGAVKAKFDQFRRACAKEYSR